MSGQIIEKGIYCGQKFSRLEICYLTFNDSISEIEYFYQKGGQFYWHFPAVKLIPSNEGPIFTTVDDSIKVFRKGKYLIVRKAGKSNVKLSLSTTKTQDIVEFRRRHRNYIAARDSLRNGQ